MKTDSSGETVLDAHGVYKLFRRGELYDSLRDLIPALTGRMFRRRSHAELGEREFWALQDVSFSVSRGEAFGIIGPNGAGKSTMLKLLTGIMRPTRGSIRVSGRLSALIEVSAGFHPDLTGRENIYLNGAILGMSRAEIRRRFDKIVEFSGLSEFLDTPVKRYSSGMYARLGFSVAAHVDPDVLLVDEVLSVGDFLFQRKCVEHMNSVLERGSTIVFVSHNLRAVATLCHRCMFLERGRVERVGPTADVIHAYLSRGQQERVERDQEALITSVTTRGPDGAAATFESGGRMEVTVEARARRRVSGISVFVQVIDGSQYPVFDTCTERLGADAISLEAGQSLRCTFELSLPLAEGTYHVSAFLHRYLTNEPYDRWRAAATFFVSGAPMVRGVVDMRPRIASCAVEAGE